MFFFFWVVILWMFLYGRARHPGPGPRVFTHGQLSIEIVNVGGWLTHGDLALDSRAQFLAVAEHRLIPSRARSVCHQLRKAGHQSVWSLACQDQLAGAHAGVGVVCLAGAPLALPSFVTPQFQEFFRLGRVLRTTLPTGKGGVVHLLLFYGYQGAEEEADQLQLTDKLLQTVLAEAQVVCVGQPMLIAGDLNADPAVISCLAKGISAGRYVDLALSYSLGAGLTLDATCRFSREEGTGFRRDSFIGCPVLLLHLMLVMSLIGGLLLIFQFLLAFVLMLGWLTLLALLYASLFGLLVGWTLMIGPPRRPLVLSRMSGMLYRDELETVPDEVVLALRDAASRSSVDDFWSIWSRCAELGLFRAYSKAGGPLMLAALPFLVEVCYGFVAGIWEAELLVARVPVSCIESVRVMRLMCIVHSTSLILPLLLYCSFVDALNLWRRCPQRY